MFVRSISLLRGALVAFACGAVLLAGSVPARAQGVTTGSMAGIVQDAQGLAIPGATVVARHEPSGTTYEAVSREDGRWSILGMRVGGPYSVTASLAGFQDSVVRELTVNLGVATDVAVKLGTVAVEETVTVTAQSDPVFSSERTGAATAVSREALASLPTINQRIQDITRLTPQAGGNNEFAGQDNRMNNITIDGSSFNNSFGLAGVPGERTGVAPISLDAIEQVQVSIAPYDVRQGNFVGANVNAVTRSGANNFAGSFYHRWRDDSMVGTKAKGLTYNPGSFSFRNTGGWASGPIIRNRAFFFFNMEDDARTAPGTTFRANKGGEPVGGNVTRVLESDLTQLSAFLKSRYGYDTGPFQDYDSKTPARRYLVKGDWNLNSSNKISVRYNQLDSDTDVLLSNSSSLGFGTRRTNTTGLNFANSNYKIMENIKSIVGEWNSVYGTNMTNNMIVGYTKQDESRDSLGAFFPFVDILSGGSVYTSFGFEPFTPNNELRYNTFQFQDNFSRFGTKHTLTFGYTAEKYRSENVFFPGSQSVYTFNSLQDFYASANGDPNVTVFRFQVRWNNIPGQDKPIQPLEVFYTGAYVQDEWRVRDNLKVTAGLRFDVPIFGETGYRNANADALTFRDEKGNPVHYDTAKLPDANILWSPRVGFNWDVFDNRNTQLRGGTGLFTGRPAYVWISNQIGNTGVLTGFETLNNTLARPFNPNPDAYKPTNVTGEPATSYELALTDANFKFPQLWRTNIAVDQRFFGWTGTAELLYNRDINGIYYINANLPAAQSSLVGPDNRPRYTSNRIYSNVSNAIVLKNQNVGRSWNFSGSVERNFRAGIFVKSAYSYGESKNTVDAGSIAFGSWNNNQHAGDPNNPGLGYAYSSPGHRFFLAATYTQQWFSWGATSVSMFWQSNTQGNASYTYSGDLNGDGGTSNDLLYIPRDTSEMNFQTFTSGGRTFTAAEQATAFDAYINQDPYLKKRRGQYAQRAAVFLPMVHRMDLSASQDIFLPIMGHKHKFQFRADVLNFLNMLNNDWGVGQRLVNAQPLTNPSIDATGRPTYRMRVVNGQLMSKTFESTAGLGDVWQVQLGFRYTF